MKVKFNELISKVVILLFAGPVVGLFLGGIYSLPAIRFTKGREPWLSLFLSAGLGITVFGLGLLSSAPLFAVAGVWALSLLLLFLARHLYGSLDHNLQRFGMVHGFTLTVLFMVVLIIRHGTPVKA